MRRIPDPMARNDGTPGPLFARLEPAVAGPVRSPFDPAPVTPPAKRGHVPMAETSLAAHRGHDREGDRLRLLDLLLVRPSTCDEVAAEWNVPPNAISGRFTELNGLGLIKRMGERRKTRAGCAAAVWHATAAGMDLIRDS